MIDSDDDGDVMVIMADDDNQSLIGRRKSLELSGGRRSCENCTSSITPVTEPEESAKGKN